MDKNMETQTNKDIQIDTQDKQQSLVDEKSANDEKKKNIKKDLLQALKFLLFSISAGVIQFGTYTLLYEACGLTHWPSNLIAITLSVIWNFTFNRKFTFKSSNNVPIAMLKVLCYYIVFIPASTWWGIALEKAGWYGLLIEALTMLINFVTEFFYSKYFVFREKKIKKQDN